MSLVYYISPNLQNLILYYPRELDSEFNIPRSQVLASRLSMASVSGGLMKINQTQSVIWCPLIWRALQLSKSCTWEIPHDFVRVSVILAEELECVAFDLSNIEGWVEYAMKLLRTKNHKLSFKNDFEDKGLPVQEYAQRVVSENRYFGGT